MDQHLFHRVRSAFLSRFGEEPLIVWSPGRINIIGEHTDYNLGYVLPAAIDLGIAMAIGKAGKGSGKWIAMDMGDEFTPKSSSLLPRPKGWNSYLMGILSELTKKGLHPDPVDLVFSGNIPPGAGLSSSAALENAFVFGLNEVFQLGLSPIDMAHVSHAAEQNYVGVRCGIMDQYAGMFGKDGKVIFLDCRTLISEYIPFDKPGYDWILLDTGVKHRLGDSAYNERRTTCEAVAKKCGVPSLREATPALLETVRPEIPKENFKKALYVLQENSRVLRAVEAIRKGDYTQLGDLMYDTHRGLQECYKVSCEELDFLVDLAREDKGVLGARMMGGGFGGCTLNLVQRKRTQAFFITARRRYRERFNKDVKAYTVTVSSGCKKILSDHP